MSDEEATVPRPRQRQGARRERAINITFNQQNDFRGAQANAIPALKAELDRRDAETVAKAVAAVRDEVNHGGAFARDMGRR